MHERVCDAKAAVLPGGRTRCVALLSGSRSRVRGGAKKKESLMRMCSFSSSRSYARGPGDGAGPSPGDGADGS